MERWNQDLPQQSEAIPGRPVALRRMASPCLKMVRRYSVVSRERLDALGPLPAPSCSTASV
jgi:hypothetical protein